MKLLIASVAILLLSSCTSLEDFQKMSPEARAHKTCNNDVTVRHYGSQVYQLSNEINQIDALLLKGYKTRENCTTITYERTSGDKPDSAIKKICTEVVIPINDYVYKFEENRKAKLSIELEEAKDKKQINFDQCFNKVVSMNAEQAFTRFDN